MKTSLYIPYNCNKVDDYGWGCAWRCIQMLLSARSENKKMEQVPSFEYLFRNFGNKQVLLELYKKMKKLKENP